MELSDLLRSVVSIFERLEVAYLVTGSMATIAYGEPRFTNDIDLVADMRTRHVEPFCAAFPAPAYYLSRDAVLQAVRQRHQFNLIHVTAGLKADIIVAQNSDFDRSRFARRRLLPTGSHGEAVFATPEDVILKKLEYFREGRSEKHVRDIIGVLKVQGDLIDQPYLDTWIHQLGLTDVWNEIRERLS